MVVPGFGYPKARMVLVGEAPGRAEDLGGEPFIGRAGKLLDQCLEELGLTREDLFISNTVKCRPPKNRNPKVPEMTACRHHLEAELKAVDPVVVVSMGIIPTRWALVGTGVKWKNLSEVVGKTYRAGLGGRERTLVVNYHPAACIYNRKLIPVFKDVMGEAARLARKGRRR
jgi:DNA polymerase